MTTLQITYVLGLQILWPIETYCPSNRNAGLFRFSMESLRARKKTLEKMIADPIQVQVSGIWANKRNANKAAIGKRMKSNGAVSEASPMFKARVVP